MKVLLKYQKISVFQKKNIKKNFTDAKTIKANKATYTLSFNEGSNLTTTVFYEQINAYLGYDTKGNKVNALKFSPDLSYNKIITGDNSQTDEKVKWGLTCDDNNSCKISGSAEGNPMYHTVHLESPKVGKTN